MGMIARRDPPPLPGDPPPTEAPPGDPSPLESLLDVKEVAALLRITPKAVYGLVETRRVPFVKIGARVRFVRRDVVAWLERNRVPSLEQ